MHSLINSQSADDRHTPLAEDQIASPGASRHWLLDAVYGRDLLKIRLRKLMPGIHVSAWRDAPELDPLLDQMIDDLALRHWQQPVGLKARLQYLKAVLQMSAKASR